MKQMAPDMKHHYYSHNMSVKVYIVDYLRITNIWNGTMFGDFD